MLNAFSYLLCPKLCWLFWFTYSYLAQLVCKYLLVPATSVPSEREFSRAGHIVNEQRACLLPQNVNMLVFLVENL